MAERSRLERFVEAQEPVYAQALEELRAGRKRSHWMWFVFPQLKTLGRSETARFFGIAGGPEARLYMAHPVLGPRLRDCTEAVLAHPDRSIEAIFGAIDAMKFRSCMTLFEAVAAAPFPFSEALGQFYCGERDPLTLQFLESEQG